MALFVDTSSIITTVTTTFQTLAVPGATGFVVFQSRAAVRLVWGSDDAAYFTYGVMTEPIILPDGFRIRAETGTADVVVMGATI